MGLQRALRVPARAGLLWLTVAVTSGIGCSPVIESSAEELTRAPWVAVPDSIGEHLNHPVPPADEEAAALELLETAMQEWRDGDPLRGAHLADSALARLPTVSDWRPLVFAELLVPTGDVTAVREALDQIPSDHEFWHRWGWSILIDVHEEAGDLEGARQAARTAAEHDTDSGRIAGYWLRSARMALAEGDSAVARQELWSALEQGDAYSSAREAARVLDGFRDRLDLDQELSVGRALLRDGRWDRASQRLSAHVDSEALPASDRLELRLGLGRALYELRRYAEAEAMLVPILDEGTSLDLQAEALFWKGRALLARGEVAAAEATFRRVGEATSRNVLAEEGIHLMLRRELETGFGPRARALLDVLLEVGVGSAQSELTVIQLGTTDYLERDPGLALQTFEAMFAGGRRLAGRQQAGYWAGIAHDRLGDPVRGQEFWSMVHQEDPLSFYGILAGERIDAPVLPPVLDPGPAVVPGLEPELRNALIRLRVHRLVPTPGSFAFELERMSAHFFQHRNGAYDFAETLIGGGFPLQGIVLGRDIHREEGEWNLRLLRIVHPFPHRDAVVREARALGLDPFFVAGLIRQESMFDTRIESVAGAVGLMQLMPATAREVAARIGVAYSPAVLTDPEVNVRLGTAFLAEMVQRFDGSIPDALSAYNAGPARARQWQQRPIYRDPEVFMEHIPFQETRHYVKVVQQYMRIYAALYGCDEFQPCLGIPYRDVMARSPFLQAPSTASTND